MATRTLIFSILIVLHFNSCKHQTQTVDETPEKQTNLSGIYKQVNKAGPDFPCEGVVSYFDIELSGSDSSFIYHTFCYPDNTDPVGANLKFKGFTIFGTCSYINSTMLRLKAFSGEVIRIKIRADRTIDLYDDLGNAINSVIYFKDTYDDSLLKH